MIDFDNELFRKIQALASRGATAGERDAAKVALGRHSERLPVRIVATIFDIDANESVYQVDYRCVDGKRRQLNIRRELFRTPLRVVDALVSAHADLPHDGKEAVAIIEAALEYNSNRLKSVTKRCGWHATNIVYPSRTFGPDSESLVYKASSDIDPAFGMTSGTLKDWQSGLAKPFDAFDKNLPSSPTHDEIRKMS